MLLLTFIIVGVILLWGIRAPRIAPDLVCPSCDATDVETCSNNLKTFGVTVIKNAVSPEILDKAKQDYHSMLSNRVVPFVPAVGENRLKKRWNILIPYEKNIKNAILDSWDKTKNIFLENYGKTPTLIEAAAFITEPFTPSQLWHNDCRAKDLDDGQSMLSTAIAFEDQRNAHGSLHVQLGQFNSCNSHPNTYAKCGTLKGDVVVWDSRVCHRGGEHDGVGPGGFNRREAIYYTHMYNYKNKVPSCSTFSIADRENLHTLPDL